MNLTQNTVQSQQGLTLVELMISTALGMLIILAVTGLIVSSKSAQSTQIDADTILDTGRFALDNISRSVKQAGYVNYDPDDAPFFMGAATPNLSGLDAASLKAKTPAVDFPVVSAYNSSDVLAIRFSGSGTPKADNTVLNCAGFGVAAAKASSTSINNRGWSIYYVARDVDDEPALFCKYNTKEDSNPVTGSTTRFAAEAIARGVESFQVLYRIDSPSHLGQFFTATELNALDSSTPEASLNDQSYWKKVTAIKVALLIRGAENSRPDSSEIVYNLFGQSYSHKAGVDKGTQVDESAMPSNQKKRFRKIISTTIQLRNSVSNVFLPGSNAVAFTPSGLSKNSSRPARCREYVNAATRSPSRWSDFA